MRIDKPPGPFGNSREKFQIDKNKLHRLRILEDYLWIEIDLEIEAAGDGERQATE